jgi:hypothetical protein
MTKNKKFKIRKTAINGSFTQIPNRLIDELMIYLTPNELKLLLFIYRRDNEFDYDRNKIALKFKIHKKNIDKIFALLEAKHILIESQEGYILNLLVDTTEMEILRLNKSIKKVESKPKKPIKNSSSKVNLSEVKHTSPEAKKTPSYLGSEVKDTSPTEVKHTSQPNSTIHIIGESLSKNISSNNTNINNTNSGIAISNNYIDNYNLEMNGSSIIKKADTDQIITNSDIKKNTSISEVFNFNNETQITNSIEFLIEHDPTLLNIFKNFSCQPIEFSKCSDSYLAMVALSYKLQDIPQWKELKENLNFNRKHLGIPLYLTKTALWLQLSEGIKNDLAEEVITQSNLSEEELIKLFQ